MNDPLIGGASPAPAKTTGKSHFLTDLNDNMLEANTKQVSMARAYCKKAKLDPPYHEDRYDEHQWLLQAMFNHSTNRVKKQILACRSDEAFSEAKAGFQHFLALMGSPVAS